MINAGDLKSALIELLFAIRETSVRLIVGGGFGLWLKVELVQSSKAVTLLKEWPEARSTQDIDLFIRPELLINPEQLKPMALALNNLGYQVVRGAEKYQFEKCLEPGNAARSIKLDLLTGPAECFQGTFVKTDQRRARPNPSVGIHAHPVAEALTLEEGLLPVTLKDRGAGEPWAGVVLLPTPFTYLMMKLFAFRDRFPDQNKAFGQYHALDLYTILATCLEEEWDLACALRDRYRNNPRVREAGCIVKDYFVSKDSPGSLRLRESPYYRKELQLDDFLSALRQLFNPC